MVHVAVVEAVARVVVVNVVVVVVVVVITVVEFVVIAGMVGRRLILHVSPPYFCDVIW